MALDDYLEPEVMIAVAVTAAVASPPVRKAVRKGAVYGLAGLMMLGDRVRDMAGKVAQAAQQQRDNAGTAQEQHEHQPQPAGT
jgi:membrane protease subunit (stomatin/prohibitin family)